MPLTSTNVELEFLGVTNGQVINAPIPCYAVTDIYVNYGDDHLPAVQGPDYSVALDLPPGDPPPINDTDYQFVVVTIHQPLIDKIGGGTNSIRIGRIVALTTDFSETDAQFKNRISTEFTRTNMKIQQIDYKQGSLVSAQENAEAAAASAAAADASETQAAADAAAAAVSEVNAGNSATVAVAAATNAQNSAINAAASAASAAASASLIPTPGGVPDAGKILLVNPAGNAYQLGILTGGGDMLRANNLIDLVDKAVSRENLGVKIDQDVQRYDDDLAAIAALGGTGLIVRTGAGGAATRSIQMDLNDFSITNPGGVAGDPTIDLNPNRPLSNTQISTFSGKQDIDSDLSAIAALASTGFAVRTAANTWNQRAITVNAPLSISNGDGVGGNPLLSLATQIGRLIGIQVFTASGTYTPTANTRSILGVLIGGGAGGGGAGTVDGASGGGGSAGGVNIFFQDSPAAQSFVVGGGGGGGPATGGNGSAGGDTTFNSGAFVAPGGNPGDGRNTNGAANGGLAAGTGHAGGQLWLIGGDGAIGYSQSSVSFGGLGGAGFWGGGGRGSAGGGAAGQTARAKGSGGGGGARTGASNSAGGGGAGGLVVVFEFG